MTSDDILSTTHLFQILEDRRVESEERSAILHKRITEMKDELFAEVDKSHKEIMAEIKEMKEENRRHIQTECEMLERLDRRISHIEQWKKMLIGGGVVLTFIVMGGLDGIQHFLGIK
jgi:hypothetical protein